MPSYYVDEDYPLGSLSNNLSLIEAIDMAQNHPLWMSTFGCYALLVVLSWNDDDINY